VVKAAKKEKCRKCNNDATGKDGLCDTCRSNFKAWKRHPIIPKPWPC